MEKWYPFALAWPGMVLAVAIALYGDFTEGQRLAILQSVISVAAILLGFLGTILALVVSFSDREVYKRLAARGFGNVLLGYLLKPMYGLFVVVILSLALLIWPSGWMAMSCVAGLGFAGTYAVLAIHRIKRPLWNLVQSVHDD